jgi:hypothetical protein
VFFAYLAHHHSRVAETLKRIRIRLEHSRAIEGVSRLDWAAIPELPAVPLPEGLPSYFSDLDLARGHSLLRLINQTASTAGFLRLVERFDSNGVNEAEVARRSRMIDEMGSHRVLRRSFLVASKLHQGAIDAGRLRALVSEKLALPGGAAAFRLHLAVQWFAIAAFGVFMVTGGKPWFLLPALATLALHPWVSRKVMTKEAYEHAISLAFSMEKLGSVALPLERLSRSRSPALRELLAPFSSDRSPTERIRRIERIVGALGVRQNFVASLLCHLPLPWNAFWTLKLERARQELEALLPEWLEAMAETEVLVSFAEFHEANPDYVPGRLVTDASFYLEGRDVRHPLIARSRAVGNDFSIRPGERCWLITGSNMSGKSTFLRTVGLSLLLAKAGARVPAASFSYRDLNLGTSLRLSDSLEDGFSSFYAEVVQLKGVLDLVKQPRPALYLIDEIFRGTNSRERLIGSRAYIRQLAETPSCGLVTTHDLELVSLEKEVVGVANHHFKDELVEGKMSFRYKIEAGPCPTTNALKVMRQGGLFLDESLGD